MRSCAFSRLRKASSKSRSLLPTPRSSNSATAASNSGLNWTQESFPLTVASNCESARVCTSINPSRNSIKRSVTRR